jgi:preprotein translocase subunit SecF
MYVAGGSGIHGFTFALLVGIIVGTYSSIAIASPILLFGQPRDGTGGDSRARQPVASRTDRPAGKLEGVGAA